MRFSRFPRIAAVATILVASMLTGCSRNGPHSANSSFTLLHADEFSGTGNGTPVEGMLARYASFDAANPCAAIGSDGRPLPNQEIDLYSSSEGLVARQTRLSCTSLNQAPMLDLSDLQVSTGAALIYQSQSYAVVPPSSSILWTGAAGDGAWTTAANWQGNVVPGPADIAYFAGSGCGLCNVTVNSDPNVSGVLVANGFQGTITQAPGVAMTIGAQGWNQASGIFLGGNSNINVSGNALFTDGQFTSTSATLEIGGAFNVLSGQVNLIGALGVAGNFILNSGAMNAGTSTVHFSGSSALISANLITFNNVVFDGPAKSMYTIWTTLHVSGSTDFDCGAGATINGGTLALAGDIDMKNLGGGTTALVINGNGPQTLRAESDAQPEDLLFPGVRLTVNQGPLGSLLLATPVYFGQPLTLVSGSIEMKGNSLTVNGSLILGASTSISLGGGVLSDSGTPLQPGSYSGGVITP